MLQNTTLTEEKTLYITGGGGRAYPDYINNFCKSIIQTIQLKMEQKP